MTGVAGLDERGILNDCSPAALAAAVEENSVAYWRACAPLLPGGEFHQSDRFTWFASDFTSAPWFNQVMLTNVGADGADAAIDERLAFFAETSRPMLWSRTPSSQPGDLEARLQSRGFQPAPSVLTGMALELAALPDPAPPAGLKIERVADAIGLETWLRCYINGFGMAEAAGRPFFDLYHDIGFADAAPFRHYVGSLNGEPVASATLFLGAGVASIWHVGTAPHARRQGIGAAMTLAPLREAQALGCRAGVLGASADGLSVYRKLGFREFGRTAQYVWTPPL
ncbi:MAG: GNAT family N-acetyltransferase [Chloroflexi bacterium]|nr:GNAT family N-acetyltransferase [Chloroflexota bacterium]